MALELYPQLYQAVGKTFPQAIIMCKSVKKACG